VEGWKKKVGRANNELEKTYITQRNLTEPFFPPIFNVKRKNIGSVTFGVGSSKK
jgi:hypothetical protein